MTDSEAARIAAAAVASITAAAAANDDAMALVVASEPNTPALAVALAVAAAGVLRLLSEVDGEPFHAKLARIGLNTAQRSCR